MSAPIRTATIPQGAPGHSLGDLLREWRRRRAHSQLALALSSGISQRHLSFVESGRATPSRELLLRLAEHLAIPLRERNQLLLAAGYAPLYGERSLDDPSMRAAHAAVERVLAGHEPYPALAVDRDWTLVAANRPVLTLLAGMGVAPTLLAPPVNVIRLSLHPEGLAPHIANLAQWRAHLLDRIQQQWVACGDERLAALLREMRELPIATVGDAHPSIAEEGAGVFVPLRLSTPWGVLSLLGTITIFGTPVDVTLSELALECFYPADETTAEALRRLTG